MIRTRTLLGGALLGATLVIGGCGMMPMAKSGSATNQLSGAQQVPPKPGSGAGTVVTSLDKATRMLRWTITYSGLSGPVTAGHFHGPAAPGANAGVVLPFTGSMASPIEGSATLTQAQVDQLKAGLWYVNLHTAANPGGEIRGQVK